MYPASKSDDEEPQDITKWKITNPLHYFPTNIFDAAGSLQHLDLSGTGLSSLPQDFGRLKHLKIAFFSDCNFAAFPTQLASCPELEMVAFRGNQMTEVPENSLPPKLRWLILTNNRINSLPKSIGRCGRLQKCMLAGNQLSCLPEEMAACRKLGLLRLSANRFRELPDWLFDLPELAFLSFAGNPCCSLAATSKDGRRDTTPFSYLPEVSWTDLQVHHLLGEGASGIISKGLWNATDQAREVAIKLFKGHVTSDGTPADEMLAACESFMESLQRRHTCTTVASHMVIYTLITFSTTVKGGHALLGDFGAASIYGNLNDDKKFEQLEALAFAHLIEDVWRIIKPDFDERELRVGVLLAALHRQCSDPTGAKRPKFSEITRQLSAINQQLVAATV
ncbi:hypothetical protein Daesc_007997 [Daldinia eschscholtzii]|uniref:Uncharacterized protein n=1 Tax=Daldinia eschscholtzii TaxID=292717 RepID=A0AAX6MH22_9PEZI